jgi:preprotein translocase subunit SecG
MVTPPDPHVRKRGPGLAVIIALVVLVVGMAVVIHNKPGAGMGGSASPGPSQSQR